MWDRIDVTRSESDTAVFYDLMFLGELTIKTYVSGLLSAVTEERGRNHYRLEYKLVRASGIGEWAAALDDISVGPASAHLEAAAFPDKRELTQGFTAAAEAWQYEAVKALRRVQVQLDSDRIMPSAKTNLKMWFNDFAWLRNRTRGHGALKAGVCSSLIEDLELAIHLVTDNSHLLNRPWAHLRRNLSGKYRVSPIGGHSAAFDALRGSSEVEHPDGIYIDFDGSLRRVPLIATDVDLTDFFLANGGFIAKNGADSKYEMLSYHTDARFFEDGTRYLQPPQEMPPSETQGLPDLDIVGGSFANLPSLTADYVRRPELERELLELLRNDRHPIITLVGQGGAGKTSVAIAVLHELAAAADFFAIIWFSARDIDLMAEGPKLVTPGVLTKEEIATTFADLMHPAWRREDNFDLTQYLAESLSGVAMNERLLFVFDNFETVLSPIELYTFIDSFIRLPNKALLTSRFRDFKADYPLTVGGMTRAEFDELVSSTVSKLGITNLVTSKYEEELFEESSGHPYVTKILLGEVARTRAAGTVERLMANQDDILTALFERTFSSIGPAARRVFLTLCNWRSAVPRLALEAALLRPSNERLDVNAALNSLEQSSLVEIVLGDQDDEFVRVPLAAYLFGKRKLRASPMKPAVDADTALLQLFGAAKQADIAKGLKPRVHRMLKAIEEKREAGENVEDELAVLSYVARKYPPALLEVADFHAEDGQQGDAIAAVTAYVEAVPDDRTGWLRLATLYQAVADGPGEVHARMEAARLASCPLEDISNAATALNRHLFNNTVSMGEEERKLMLRDLVNLLQDRTSECDATDLSRLAWLLLSLDDKEAAKEAVRLGLERDSSNRYCLNLAERLKLEGGPQVH